MNTQDLYKLDENLREEERKKTQTTHKRASSQQFAHTKPRRTEIETDVLVVLITKQQATASLYTKYNTVHLFTIDKQDDMGNKETTASKIQQHRLDHLQKFYKETADYLQKEVHTHNIKYTVVIGHEEVTTKQFISYIHEDIYKKIIATEFISPDILANETIIPEIIVSALQKKEIEKEQEVAELLARSKGEKRIITGLEQVIHAVNRSLVVNLYINNSYEHPGYICKKDGTISLEKTPCPLCESTPEKVNNIMTHLIEHAKKNARNVFVFKHKPEVMDNYDFAAASLITSS